MTTLQQDPVLIWPITHQGRQTAHQLSQRHTQREIVERVRRNALAVWVVHDFLRALGIATDPTTSDSWNPVLQLIEDVADLPLPGGGRLECRPITINTLTDRRRCPIPPEVRSDRLGYVMVVLDEAVGEASLLGFSAAQQPSDIGLDRLQAMAALPDYLQGPRGVTPPHPITHLGPWLAGQIDEVWQSLESLMPPSPLRPAFRQGAEEPPAGSRGVRRAQRLVLGPTTAIILAVGVTAGPGAIELVIELYPAPPETETAPRSYLPDGLTMKILDASGTVVLVAPANATDNALQMSFTGQPGEAFSLQLEWRSTTLTEQFLI